MPLSSAPAIAARSVDRRDRSSSTTSAIGRIAQSSMLWPCASCATPSCTPIVAIASVVDRRRHGQNGRSSAAAVKLSRSPVARVYRRNDIQVVWCSHTVDEPVFAVWRTPAGRWSIVAPCCRDLNGWIGVRRIAVLDEPAAGGAKVIKLREHAGIARRA